MGVILTPTYPSVPLLCLSGARKVSSGGKGKEISFPHPFSSTHINPSVKSFCFNIPQEPILSEALKEPVAFVGGMFAGLLRLDLNEDPLKEWVTRTVEASGITEEEAAATDGLEPEREEAPQQIEIE